LKGEEGDLPLPNFEVSEEDIPRCLCLLPPSRGESRGNRFDSVVLLVITGD
jgi:hypothetical protein